MCLLHTLDTVHVVLDVGHWNGPPIFHVHLGQVDRNLAVMSLPLAHDICTL